MPSIKFAVSDTGSGIPEKLQARLFEPFVQGSAERVRPHAGSGLGLAICRKIVSAMEGTIELVSSTPKGSRFEVIVPLRKPVSSAQDTSVQIAESSGFLPLDVQVAEDSLAQRGAGRGVVGSLHILVAEDTPANQMVVKLMLNGLGHDVTLVNNGAEAVEAFGSARFDAVFLDIQMPVMDGYTAARAIRSSGDEGRSVPIAALTAFTQDSDREKARDCGIRHFVTKPIRAKDLTRVLEDMFADTPLHSELTNES
jgi:CheY-like chemotaxis protein